MVKEVFVMLSAYNIGGGDVLGFASVLVVCITVIILQRMKGAKKE
jgi:hypothetical protein